MKRCERHDCMDVAVQTMNDYKEVETSKCMMEDCCDYDVWMVPEIKLGKYLLKDVPEDKIYLLNPILEYMDKHELTTMSYKEYENRDKQS
ncbi:hypothetical protein [Sutcliffiella horikoshii]|uniref:hypothetical protein n=1 Tax=Sutcliffiella horikoshii TaxID=79883 RepID=UPI003CF4794F